MPYTDLSRIERKILKENYLLLLGFPTGYIPLRMLRREEFFLIYDPMQEAAISTRVPASTSTDGIRYLGWQAPVRLGSQFLTGRPPDIFSIKASNHIYQLFYGVAPSPLKVFKNQPAETAQLNLDEFTWSQSANQFGFIDGFESPFYSPSPMSEIIRPPELDFALGFANPIYEAVDPLLNFYVNRLEVGVTVDADLVWKMLNGREAVSIKTVGGMSRFDYTPEKFYGIVPLQLGMSKAEVARILGAFATPEAEAGETTATALPEAVVQRGGISRR